jgi:hypothetical protein
MYFEGRERYGCIKGLPASCRAERFSGARLLLPDRDPGDIREPGKDRQHGRHHNPAHDLTSNNAYRRYIRRTIRASIVIRPKRSSHPATCRKVCSPACPCTSQARTEPVAANSTVKNSRRPDSSSLIRSIDIERTLSARLELQRMRKRRFRKQTRPDANSYSERRLRYLALFPQAICMSARALARYSSAWASETYSLVPSWLSLKMRRARTALS